MCSPASAALLVLVLLASAPAARAEPADCQAEVRQVPLGLGAQPPAELCISPGLSTTLLFDSALAGEAVVLEGREHFRRVEVGESLLLLLPSHRLEPGQRLRLAVRFADGQAPESATFVLLVHRARAVRQVEVSRPQPSAHAYQAQLRLKEEQLQHCLEQNRWLAEAGEPPSFRGLFAAGLLGREGLITRTLEARELAPAPDSLFAVKTFRLHRARRRLLVELELSYLAPRPWVPQGAALRGPRGEVLEAYAVWQPDALESGERQPVWVELPLPPQRAEGYTLELWDEGKALTLTLPGLRLP